MNSRPYCGQRLSEMGTGGSLKVDLLKNTYLSECFDGCQWLQKLSENSW